METSGRAFAIQVLGCQGHVLAAILDDAIWARACFTIATNFLAFSAMISGLFDFSASACTNSPPRPNAAAPASINSAAVFRLTPPVGTSGIWGSGPFRALMYFAPPTSPQGKILTKSDPPLQAGVNLGGVKGPSILHIPSRN